MSSTAAMTKYRGADGRTGRMVRESVRAALNETAKRHGMTVISNDERLRQKEIMRAMRRCRRVIDAANAAFFGERDRSIDQVILDLKNFTYEANGIRDNRVVHLLEELKQLRRRTHEGTGEGDQKAEAADRELELDETVAAADDRQPNHPESMTKEAI